MSLTNHRPRGTDPQREASLGAEYIPDLHRKPTFDDASMWCQGAKAALAFVADLMRTAHEAGKCVEDIIVSVEGSTAAPCELSRYGHTYQTAVITRRDESPDSTDPGHWFAWQVRSRGEYDTPGYLRAVTLCGLAAPPTRRSITPWMARPFGSQGNVYRIATQRRRTKMISPVTVRFEGGYPRYTSTPKEGQSLREFVFACAVGLGSERLTSLIGNDQALFEVEGGRVKESDLASGYGGKTVTVVMVYDPTEPPRLNPIKAEDPSPAATTGAWLSGEDMISAFYAK